MYDEILSSIDNIDECVMEAEMNVISAMINEYDKAIMIMENYNGDSYDCFDIFQEGFKDEVNKPISGTKDEKIIKRILMAIPRLIATLVRKLINAFSSIKSTKILRNLKKAVNEYGVKRRRKKYNLPVKHDTIYNPNPKDQDIPDHEVKQIKEHINVEEGWIKSRIMRKKGRTDKEDHTFENYIDIMKEHLQNYEDCFNKYNNNKDYSIKELYKDIYGEHDHQAFDKAPRWSYNGNPKMKFYQFNKGYYNFYNAENYYTELIDDNKYKQVDRSEKIPFSEFLSRYEKIFSECNELTKIAIGLSKQIDTMFANSKYKDDVTISGTDSELSYFRSPNAYQSYKRYKQVHKKTDGGDYMWYKHLTTISNHLTYSINTLLYGKKYLDKEAELVTQALNEYNKQ